MKNNIQNTKHFNNLIQSVDGYGFYQKKVLIILLMFWMISGMQETFFFFAFDLGNPYCDALTQIQCLIQMCQADNNINNYFPKGKPNTFPYILDFYCKKNQIMIFSNIQKISSFLGLLIFGWFSIKYGKKKIIIINNLIMLLGNVLLLFSSYSKIILILGISFSSIPHHLITLFLISIYCEITFKKYLSLSIVSCMISKDIGRIIMGSLFNIKENPNIYIMLLVLIGLDLTFLLLHRYYDESLRFLMDNDIFKAFQVLKKISIQNKQNHIDLDVDNSFVINKVKIRKYNYWFLFSFRSIRLISYSYTIIMFFNGFLYFLTIGMLQYKVNKHIQTFILTSFNLIATIPCYLFLKIYQRKKIEFYSCLCLILFCIFIFFLNDSYSEIVFKISSLGIILFFNYLIFLVIFTSIIQVYPHTIRTLALTFFLSMFYIGNSFANLIISVINDQKDMHEVFIQSAIILLLHLYPLKQTKETELLYEIIELEEEEQQDQIHFL